MHDSYSWEEMTCTKCRGEIYRAGCEYYCIKCFYHLNGSQRIRYRRWLKNHNTTAPVDLREIWANEDEIQAKAQQKAMILSPPPSKEYCKEYYIKNKDKIRKKQSEYWYKYRKFKLKSKDKWLFLRIFGGLKNSMGLKNYIAISVKKSHSHWE